MSQLKLSISSDSDILNASDILGILCDENLSASVYQVLSSVRNDDNCCMKEYGAIILLHSSTKEQVSKLWTKLRDTYNLECAHVATHDFRGCIFNYLQPSACPYEQRKRSRTVCSLDTDHPGTGLPVIVESLLDP